MALQYIYLVRLIPTNELITTFARKYEANYWASRSYYNIKDVSLYRLKIGENQEVKVPWEL